MFFKLPTLILLFPMLLVLEIGLWLFAVRGGWLDKRIAVYKYWLKKENWRLWLKKRANIQVNRKISDREMLKYSVPSILFQEKAMENPVLLHFGNPLMKLYYWVVVKGLIYW
jgi:hypothetical protein